jgi:glycosyltransferase involved in cell wall biosynthesis
MDPESARVAMLYQDPHPAHRGFAEAIGADLVDYHRLPVGSLSDTIIEDIINGLRYPQYDAYIVEGSRPLYGALTHRLTRGGKLIYLCADHGLYQLGSDYFEGDSALKSLIGKFGKPAVRALAQRRIDGVVAVSEFAAEFTRPIVGPDTPITIAHPYIQPEPYAALDAVKPDLSSTVAVTVGRACRYKGVDMLVQAWPAVREEFPEAELHVVGSGHPKAYAEVPGVHPRGYVEELADAFEPASLFVQPSRVDTFPVSTLEAMRAGLVPLVTNTAGTRSEASAIHSELVVQANPESIADGVRGYFRRKLNERETLSAEARNRAKRFDPDSRKAAFREAFRDVLKAL